MIAKQTKDNPKSGLSVFLKEDNLSPLIELKQGNEKTCTIGVVKNKIEQTKKKLVNRNNIAFMVKYVSDKSVEDVKDFVASINNQDRCEVHIISIDVFSRVFAGCDVCIVAPSKALNKKIVEKIREAKIHGHLVLLEELGEDLSESVIKAKKNLPGFNVDKGYRNSSSRNESDNKDGFDDSALCILPRATMKYGAGASVASSSIMDDNEIAMYKKSDFLSSFIPELIFCLDFLSKYDYEDYAFNIKLSESEFSEEVYAETKGWMTGFRRLASLLNLNGNNLDKAMCWDAFTQYRLLYLKDIPKTIEDILPRTKESYKVIEKSERYVRFINAALIQQGLLYYSRFK